MLTANQIAKLKEIIDKRILLFVTQNFSPDNLTSEDQATLKQAKIDITKIKPSESLIYQSYAFGILSGSIPKGQLNALKFNQFKSFLESDKMFPLTAYEKAVINSLETQTLSYVRGMGDKMKRTLDDTIVKEQRNYFESTLRDGIKTGIQKKESLRVIASDLNKTFGDFSRDFDRIVETQSHLAFDEGRAAFAERNYGEDAKVYKTVYSGACKWCIKLYLTNGIGSQPKIFKLSELRANGNNVGRKAAEWLPIIGDHPYGRCTLEFLPDGYQWSDEKGRFIPGETPKVERQSKLKIQIGEKKFEV